MVNRINKKKLHDLISAFTESDLTIQLLENIEFHDEPYFYNCVTHFNLGLNFRKKYGIQYASTKDGGSGFSVNSFREAFIKSLFESMERLCLRIYKREGTFSSAYSDKDSRFLNPSLFSNNKKKVRGNFQWVSGKNILTDKEYFIPSQCVYLNDHIDEEVHIGFPQISTGAAAGIDLSQTLLNGIYEVVERDAVLGVYLNGITLPNVDISSINSNSLQKIINECKRYNLELHVIDATTDLGIPVYISVIIDRTGVGPSVSVGSKCSFNTEDAIMGAVIESFMTRFVSRIKLNNQELFLNGKSNHQDQIADRIAHWYIPDSIKNIQFMIASDINTQKTKVFRGNVKMELNMAIEKLSSLNFDIFQVNISIEEFQKMGVFVNKIIIPGLQPLYLDENGRDESINTKRLSQICKHFKRDYKGYSKFPHPFL